MKLNSEIDVVFIDLDSTLITTLSGKTFPTSTIDMQPIWKTWEALKNWATKKSNRWYIFIVSNQGGMANGSVNEDAWSMKAEFIGSALVDYIGKAGYVDFRYCKTNSKTDPFRKPNPGMLEDLRANYVPDMPKSKMVMIGDASGRPGDFSDSDLKVAENFGIDYIDVRDL